MRSSVQLRPIGIPRICVLALLLVFVSSTAHAHAQHIGVLFGSFGDVESCQCVNSYFKGALERLVGYEIPVRDEIERKVVADLVWSVSKKETFEMYTSISPQCNTSFISRSSAQSEAVVQQLRAMGVRATAYTAYNFVTGPGCPTGMTVADQMAAAAADAVDLLVVVNQNGAQNSNSTIGVVYDDVRAYLRSAAGGTWNATIIGIDDYSQSSEFNRLLVQHTTEALEAFPSAAPPPLPQDTCIVFACHGNPQSLTEAGDPYESQIRANFRSLQHHFLSLNYSNVTLAFQNHGGKGTKFPQSVFPWSSPPDTDVVPQIAAQTCIHVLISGIVSFVVDNSETEFDERIDDVRQLTALAPAKRVFVPEVFSSSSNGFASNAQFNKYLAGVVADAAQLKGDVRLLFDARS